MRVWYLLLGVGCTPSIDIHRPEDAPVATILTPVDGALVAQGRVELRGRVSDLQDPSERLFAVWSLRREAGWEEACSGFALEDGATQCTTEVGPEHLAVGLRVTDVAGFVGEAEAAIAVEAVAPPEVVIEAPLPPGPYYAGLPVPLEVYVTDADDALNALRLEVTSSLDGLLPLPGAPDGSGRLFGALALREGVHTLEVTATDPGGAVGRASALVAVGPANEPPGCRWEAPADGAAVLPATEVVVEVVVSDEVVAPDTLPVELSSDLDGRLWAGRADPSGRVRVVVPWLALGDHALALRVDDPAGATVTCGSLLHVDTPPELVVTSPPDGARLTSVLTELTVTDARSGPAELRVSLVSDHGGLLWTREPDDVGALRVETSLPPGPHTLTWTARDAFGLERAVVRSVVIGD